MASTGDPRYTQKIRAKRIALDYFKRPHPFRRWRLILSIAAPLVAAAWLLVYAGQSDQRIYNSGTVSVAHQMFWQDCKVCHGPGPAPGATTLAAAGPTGYWARVSDNACTACHAGPAHHANEQFTPRCASCHLEHKGRTLLMEAADQHCTQCHKDLKTKDGQPPVFTASITSLRDHPQFAVDVRPQSGMLPPAGGTLERVKLDDTAKLVDHTAIKLNHTRHLKAGLAGLDKVIAKSGMTGLVTVKGGAKDGKDSQQLGCTFCHRPDATWQYMQPINYKDHCSACHELATGIGAIVAPHDKPPVARAYVWGAAADLFTSCRGKMPAGDEGKALRETCEAAGIAAAAAPAPAGAPAEEAPSGRRRRGAFMPELLPEALRNAALGLDLKDLKEIVLAQRRRGGGEEEAAPAAPSAPSEPEGESGGRRRRRGGEEETPPPAAGGGGAGGGAGAWASEQLPNAENALFKTKDDGCQKCHKFDATKTAAPLPEVIPPKIPARWLPHSKFDHSPHRPIACGECHKAAASSKTADVLMPAINTCRDCHQPKGGARSGCVECHRYHDKSKERDADGPYKIPALLSGVGRKGPDRIR